MVKTKNSSQSTPINISIEEFARGIHQEKEGVDYVRCKICGYRNEWKLFYHLKNVHRMTTEQYKKRFPNNPVISEKQKEKERKYYQENREERNKQSIEIYHEKRLRTIEIYGGQCEFQEQTLTYGGKEWKFCACSVTDPDCLVFHHKEGSKGEDTWDVIRKILKHGRQDDLELLCGIHHTIADIRDGTRTWKGSAFKNDNFQQRK